MSLRRTAHKHGHGRRLNPDQLGAKGEARFPELCLDGRIECNRSERDRTGWDFLVEFPISEGDASPLHDRRMPLEARVQVKTIWEGQSRVKLRLSSAERLAKAPTPAFLCILTVSHDSLEFTKIQILHFWGALTEQILKDVRKLQASGRSTKINKTTLAVNVNQHGSSLPVTGQTLRAEMSRFIGRDMASYIEKKIAFLQSCGFEAAPLRGSFTVQGNDVTDFSDFLLGLRPLSATQFELRESRWGIELPALPNTVVDGEIWIVPDPIPVQVTFRSPKKGKPVSFSMGLRRIPKEFSKLTPSKELLENANLKIVTEGEKFNLKISSANVVPTSVRTLRALYELEVILAQGGVDVRVLQNGRLAKGFTLNDPLSFGDQGRLDAVKTLIQDLEFLAQEAGIDDFILPCPPDQKFYHSVELLHAMVAPRPGVSINANFTIKIIDGSTIPVRNTEAILIDGIKMHDGVLAFYSVCRVALTETADATEYATTATNFNCRQISMLDGTRGSLEAFRAEAEALTGISLVLAP
ncbi:hypothetical protein [Roseomonas sp. AR75]|uniref:hypothetical protein n=1 Tax=Roseomonas sp. AR75 TaxID=2562311 RepID=UPI0010C0A1D4|nr:hypothetical protein [Roseomonas sp. AR75]